MTAQQIIDSYDFFLAALCVWREARGASREAKQGVAAVIRNRALDKQRRWPRTLRGVVLQPFQFSCFNHNDPNAVKFPEGSEVAWMDCVDAVLNEKDPTQGATHYFSCDIAPPDWADPAKKTAEIGPFSFYKL